MIARVFPRRTQATPTDPLTFIGDPPLFIPDGITEVRVSVAFTWDLPVARMLADSWARIAPVQVGGPALGLPGGDFESGQYLRHGYTITSRGCPNRCWFCSVPKREGTIRELSIHDGWNVLDDNLLACSDGHITDVFAMLARQPKRPQFTGGLEPKRITRDVAAALVKLHPESIFLAYDTPDDWDHVKRAAEVLKEAGQHFAGHRVRCYVLIGFPSDTFEKAETRLRAVLETGIFPAAMLWRDDGGQFKPEWRAFQRRWFRPALIAKLAGPLDGEPNQEIER
ncbi:MAG: hypothetical protein WC911_02065 [Thermoleophilia bacterium]